MSYGSNTYYSDYCDEPSWLYRLYGSDGTLLYVGISTNPPGRIPTHRRKPWGSLIVRHEIEWHPNREAAKAAERFAIHHEHPEHNIVRPQMECC